MINYITVGKRKIGPGFPTYIISEVGSNFDGDLKRAKYLAKLSLELGADAFKIQNFLAEKIVSETGFSNLQVSFQSKWKKSVVDVYKAAEFPRKWLLELSDYCKKIGIDFFSAPYDKEAVDLLEEINAPIYKIGSGEIDNLEFIDYVAKAGKPILISCGSSTIGEIDTAIKTIRKNNNQIVLLQCVTNYPSPIEDANIRAMAALGKRFGVPVGYSDHTAGSDAGGNDPLFGITVPIGAVACGACVIEKHFTDDIKRVGPDHPFAANPKTFKVMVDGIRAMEKALGDGVKRIMPSEKQTVIIQRRGIYANRGIKKGEILKREMVEFLRPAKFFRPPALFKILGKKAKMDVGAGEPLKPGDF